jgi:hypothetical protein
VNGGVGGLLVGTCVGTCVGAVVGSTIGLGAGAGWTGGAIGAGVTTLEGRGVTRIDGRGVGLVEAGAATGADGVDVGAGAGLLGGSDTTPRVGAPVSKAADEAWVGALTCIAAKTAAISRRSPRQSVDRWRRAEANLALLRAARAVFALGLDDRAATPAPRPGGDDTPRSVSTLACATPSSTGCANRNASRAARIAKCSLPRRSQCSP